ncbi:MAG: DNA adenine methylase [Alphaproteobacteria bacterium]|nr:DNA adenine methylase [Alphaproteobacteria bacterium]
MIYQSKKHAASKTDSYVFNQLIPYIGNKRKLLGLIGEAVKATGVDPEEATFLDLFSGSGVVARFAKKAGFRVAANDWEPYAEAINGCTIAQNSPPVFFKGKTYEQVLGELNALPPLEGWVARHLCPENDERFDTAKERMFYTRANGMRIDAIREKIRQWADAGKIDGRQAAALLSPLLYQACYTSNTSGVFKGFHNGWGGQTGTALYRIKSRLTLAPAVFYDNKRKNEVFRCDATELAREYDAKGPVISYIDPPYNQHPYGANYHVLNSIALWDKPELPRIIGKHNKAAIRTDWRTERRSKYNHKGQAAEAYEELLGAAPSGWLLTSYSTDGNIPLESLVRAACRTGATSVVTQGYKRYRVSRQRFSEKPLNVEFVLITKKGAKGGGTASAIAQHILKQETEALDNHHERPSNR